MLITHANKANRPQTPKTKIKHIVTNKNIISQNSNNNRQKPNINNPLQKFNQNLQYNLHNYPKSNFSNHSNKSNQIHKQTYFNKQTNINKQNINPNITKSPASNQQKYSIHLPQQTKQVRVKSQYYTGTNHNNKPSPIKKILFVKNINYKSAKTSKNSSLDNKKQQNISQQQKNTYSILNNQNINSKYLSHSPSLLGKDQSNLNHKKQQSNYNKQRKSCGHFEKDKAIQINQNNESQIYQQGMGNKLVKQLKPKQMIKNIQKPYNNIVSQANYRVSRGISDEKNINQKVNSQYNQKYSQGNLKNYETNPSNISNQNFSTKTYGIQHRINNLQYPSTLSSQSFNYKNIKMCPNIQSSDLSSLQTFKHKNLLFPSSSTNSNNHKQPNTKPLLTVDKQKKQSLSAKKRNNRMMKINYKTAQINDFSANKQNKFQQNQTLLNKTLESQIMVSSPGNNLFTGPNNKYQLNNTLSTQFYKTTASQKETQSTKSKGLAEQQSTLVQTKKFQDQVLQNFNGSGQFSKITLKNIIQKRQPQIIIKNKNFIQKHNIKHYCLNHPQKQAKFKVNKQCEKPYYCSKCTVLLVTQGYKVMQNIQAKNYRLQKLKSFIFQLQIIEPKVKESIQMIIQLQKQLQYIQANAQKQIQSYYKTLIQTLQSHKQTALKSLNYHSKKLLSEFQLLKTKINQNQSEIQFLKDDIIPNVDTIVDQGKLAEQNFLKIIKEHQQRLQNISKTLENTKNLMQGKHDKKIFIKSVQIPKSELKIALNNLQRTQLLFVQKTLKLSNQNKVNENIHQHIYPSPNNSPTHQFMNVDMNETKRSFSFDEQNIENSFYIPSSKKKNNQREQLSPNSAQNKDKMEKFYQLTESVRMSFGNRLQNHFNGSVQSPTFKAI